MLFQQRFHAGLRNGSIRQSFRVWSTPKVKAGGRSRFGRDDWIEVEAVERVPIASVTDDARRAGFSDRAALITFLGKGARALAPGSKVHRVALRYAGRRTLSPPRGSPEEIAQRLDRMDRQSRHGPWTREALRAIARQPRTRAASLAAKLGRETLEFKADVRRLKRLGLTESHASATRSPRWVAPCCGARSVPDVRVWRVRLTARSSCTRIMVMKVLPIGEARRRLPELVRQVVERQRSVVIGRRGRPEVALVPASASAAVERRPLRGLVEILGTDAELERAGQKLGRDIEKSLARTGRLISGSSRKRRA